MHRFARFRRLHAKAYRRGEQLKREVFLLALHARAGEASLARVLGDDCARMILLEQYEAAPFVLPPFEWGCLCGSLVPGRVLFGRVPVCHCAGAHGFRV